MTSKSPTSGSDAVEELHRSRSSREEPDEPGAAVSELGTGLIGTLAGITVFLVLMLFAVQVAFDLYARSAVASVAFDAARVVAGSDSGATASSLQDAEQNARATLGRYGQRARFSWQVTQDDVQVTVAAQNPTVLPRAIASPLDLDEVVQRAVVRRERVR